ncbi:MAG TPA: hypothetical protein VIV40_15220 [Kofleriaceae bacterium]
MKRACLLFALAACASEPEPIEYTGQARRFVVDSVVLPQTTTEARTFAADLDGDRTVDNQLGSVISTLNAIGDVTSHGNEMIASGALASSVEIVADDFANDDTVALRYFGADGDDAQLIGGRLENGTFTWRDNGSGAVHLPVFVDSDPIVIPLVHMRASLAGDGHGGYDAMIQGAVPADVARKAAFAGVAQMFENRPGDHIAFFRMLDAPPYDLSVTQDEFDHNSLIASLLAPDLELDGNHMLSLGFKVHLSPCAEGRCATTPAATCFDRMRNGDETDVDCGGACEACASGFACAAASDCESGACNGTCAAASCSDGVRDGWETDVDCGTQCGGCAVGRVCFSNADCTSGQCGAPCTSTLCGDYVLDVCR